MKQTKIESLHTDQVTELVPELFEQISLLYDIKPADQKFTALFVRLLKKEYHFLTFEQIESAFERSANGLIDIYFRRIGSRPDTKVKSFNVPDLVKVINAYLKYLNNSLKKMVDKKINPNIKVFSDIEKHEVSNQWLDGRVRGFELYKSTGERTPFVLPGFVADLYDKLGLIDKTEIDENTTCEQLVYKCYDKLIEKGEHLEDYFEPERNKYL